jgi:SAM-dependent methyltransferase
MRLNEIEILSSSKDVQKFWSSHPCSGLSFETIDQIIEYRKRKDPVIKIFLEGLAQSKDAYILDIGCGQGPDLTQMTRKYPNAFGGDLSIGALKSALKLNPKLVSRAVQFDARSLPYQPAFFDAIYSHGVIHHSPNIEQSVSEIFRVLKPGGRGRILLYSKYSPKGLAVRLVRFLFAHKRVYKLVHKLFPNSGSAVDELFLCPVMQMHSRREVRCLFSKFVNVENKAWHIGITHFLFIMGVSDKRFIYRIAARIETVFERLFGFYWVVTFKKPK